MSAQKVLEDFNRMSLTMVSGSTSVRRTRLKSPKKPIDRTTEKPSYCCSGESIANYRTGDHIPERDFYQTDSHTRNMTQEDTYDNGHVNQGHQTYVEHDLQCSGWPYYPPIEIQQPSNSEGRSGTSSTASRESQALDQESSCKSSESWSLVYGFLAPGISGLNKSHHQRSGSERVTRPQDRRYIEVDDWDLGDNRRRVASMPCRSLRKPGPQTNLSRLRSFTISRKGVVHDEGDCFLNRSTSVTSSGDLKDAERSGNNSPVGAKARNIHRILVTGSEGVGKKSLIREFINEKNVDYCKILDDTKKKLVSILLDGRESSMEFVHQTHKGTEEESVDAYLVVYSVDDRRSFEAAIDRINEIRETHKRVAVILVANKTDLVRSKIVNREAGMWEARRFDSKFIEVSAAIHHKIDELLVGVLKQIRLIDEKYRTPDSDAELDCCLLKARKNVLAKIFKGEKGASNMSEKSSSKSSDNLYVL